MQCVLCESDGGTLIWRDAQCRIVRAEEPDYPAFCRVIWNAHAAEMSDLTPAERAHCMRVVFALEQAMRELLEPDKMNLACLGNLVPHVHWHVVARWREDAHFPQPIWAAAQRTAAARALPAQFDARLRASVERLLS